MDPFLVSSMFAAKCPEPQWSKINGEPAKSLRAGPVPYRKIDTEEANLFEKNDGEGKLLARPRTATKRRGFF